MSTQDMNQVEFVDRYSATGTPYPDENSCDECDGMGLYPIQHENLNEEACKTEDKRLIVIGQVDTDGKALEDDGWSIVQCPVCKGTRKKPAAAQKEVD